MGTPAVRGPNSDALSLKAFVQVTAVVPGLWPGSHAEYVVTQASCCSLKPSNLDFSEAAALPYVASTAWAALVSVARMNTHSKPRSFVDDL